MYWLTDCFRSSCLCDWYITGLTVIYMYWLTDYLSSSFCLKNSWHDVWETEAEIPFWWRIATQIWVVLLISWSKFHERTTNQKHCPDLGSDASSVWNSWLVSQTSFSWETSGGVAQCGLFSRASLSDIILDWKSDLHLLIDWLPQQ